MATMTLADAGWLVALCGWLVALVGWLAERERGKR